MSVERDVCMEIRDYVGRAGWRLLVLLLVPIAAGAAAFALLADTPPQYEAATVLTVPSTVAGGASSGSVSQYMANFDQAIMSDPVVTKVAGLVDRGAGEVRDGLDVTQLGSSNLVRISFRGPDRGDASTIVEEATRSTFDLVAQIQLPFGQGVEVLKSRVRSTQAELDTAEARLEDFLVENGLVLPREQYLMVASDVARLEDELAQAVPGTPTATLEAELRDRRQQLQQLGATIPEWERLQADVDRANEDLDAAQDELRLTEDQLAHVRPQTTPVSTERIPEIQTIGRGVGVAAAGGFFVAMVVLLLLPSKQSQGPRRAMTVTEPPGAGKQAAAGG
jgi:capsular polysaccharide biosynthesis protein